jgi:hypothetical protein
VLAATTVSWLGVNLVGDEVSPAGPAALSQAEVRRQIHDAQTATQRWTPSPAPGVGSGPGSSTADPPDVTGGEGSSPDRSGAGPSGTSRPTVPGQSGPTGQGPTGSQRSVVTQGGTVVLTCTGDRLTFTNITHTSEIKTTCAAGILTVNIDEGAAKSDD